MNTARLKRFFLKLAVAALAAVVLVPVAAQAQIAFRNAASASARPAAFRAAASASGGITFIGAGTQVESETAGSITPAIPSGTVANDFAILIIAGRPTDTTEPATPSGWTHRSTHLREVGANDLRITTYFRVLAGGDANPSITLPASWVGTAAGMTGQIAVWRNVNTSTPWDTFDVENEAGAATTWVPPAITTVTNGALVVTAVATSDNNALNFSSAQGFTLRMSGGSYDTSLGGDHAIGLAEKIQSGAGAVTMPTWNQSSNASDQWAGITFALKPGTSSLTIAKPSGTVQNDVMIASIGFRPTTATITPPSGWTLVGSRIDCTLDLNYNSLVVYRKTAGASEPASYMWTFGGASDAVGGIQTFSDVDTTGVDATGGQAIASTAFPSYATPSITTTVANTMLVTSHTFATSGTSGSTWSAPAGMSESYDLATQAGPTDAGQSIGSYRVVQTAAGATGAKTATASYAQDCGAAHILALRPLTQGLTINKPAGTIANDVMVAAIATVEEGTVVTPPAGWTLLRRTENNGGSADLALIVYYRVAGGSEPASYFWGASGSTYQHIVGGIQSFSGVDTGSPINVEAGECTPQPTPCGSTSLSHDTPSVTPTVANTMLVAAHAYESSNTWTPILMTEAYDQASLTVPDAAGLAIVGSYTPHVFLATGAKTAIAAGNADVGVTHILALRPLPASGVAGGFNAYDTTTTPATAATGFIRTKVAGTSVSLAIVALNLPRTAVETSFTGTVRVELLDASNNTGALDAYGCRSTWTVIQTLSPDPTYVAGDLGRKTLSGTYSNSYPDLRLRISYPTVVPTRIGCSNDNFALRPNALASYSVTDSGFWETAGTTRTLNNTATMPLGITHKAGRPFTVRATAVDGAGSPATTTNYTGAPTPALTDCGASNPCTSTLGTVTLGSSFVAGVLNSTTASYDNVGSFNLRLEDRTFSNVDASDGTPADCTASGRWVCSSTLAVGRFVPDNFEVSLNTPTFGTTCSSFTYIGELFNYTVAPRITVTARNFAGGTTTAYTGSLWQITSSSLTGKAYTAAAGTLDTSGDPSPDPAIDSSTPGSGVGRLDFSSGTGFFFTRSTPVAPFDADISVAINVIDADGVSYASNPARFAQATAGNGIAFSAGKPMRFGRLAIRNANGSPLMPLLVALETQYYTGAPVNAFITNTADSCTSLAAANVAMSGFTQNLAACETANTLSGGFSAGRKTLLLPAPGAANNGSVNLRVNIAASASGTTCTTQGGGTVSVTSANRSYLQGNWTGGAYNQDPTARATFGVYQGSREIIFVRENF